MKTFRDLSRQRLVKTFAGQTGVAGYLGHSLRPGNGRLQRLDRLLDQFHLSDALLSGLAAEFLP